MIHRSHTLVIATFGLALAASAAHAAAPPLDPSDWPGRVDIATVQSAPGETLKSFLLRAGAQMVRYTFRSGFEVCGTIARRDDRYSLMLKTDSVQIGCVVSSAEVESGFTSTGEAIHTHPRRSQLWITAQDLAWARRYYGESLGGYRKEVIGVDPKAGFSTTDFAAGAGWLIAGGKLMHQNGPRAIRKFGFVRS